MNHHEQLNNSILLFPFYQGLRERFKKHSKQYSITLSSKKRKLLCYIFLCYIPIDASSTLRVLVVVLVFKKRILVC